MSHRDSLTEDYEFEVRGPTEYSKGYSVSLPHQCDDWEIVGADVATPLSAGPHETEDYTDDYPNLPKKKELAVKQMELFVKRAQEALEKLKSL